MPAQTFPDGFRWGTATAAHQIEGGNVNNDWWRWEHTPGSGTSGIGASCSSPSSGTWKLDCRLKIALPCWMATTRRVVNDRPSRMRSTS